MVKFKLYIRNIYLSTLITGMFIKAANFSILEATCPTPIAQ